MNFLKDSRRISNRFFTKCTWDASIWRKHKSVSTSRMEIHRQAALLSNAFLELCIETPSCQISLSDARARGYSAFGGPRKRLVQDAYFRMRNAIDVGPALEVEKLTLGCFVILVILVGRNSSNHHQYCCRPTCFFFPSCCWDPTWIGKHLV